MTTPRQLTRAIRADLARARPTWVYGGAFLAGIVTVPMFLTLFLAMWWFMKALAW